MALILAAFARALLNITYIIRKRMNELFQRVPRKLRIFNSKLFHRRLKIRNMRGTWNAFSYNARYVVNKASHPTKKCLWLNRGTG